MGSVESRDALATAWRQRSRSHLVGITGAPGSGKSTLTNVLVRAWRGIDRRVAVVAVDPSSPFSGGALLGDRIRMQDHIDDEDVFVRSMSSRGRLGGVSSGTAGAVTILAAAGFDPVVVETVGVGQSEVDVMDNCESVVVVLNPGWGDDVQADKAGILEIGDVFVINKADRPEVKATRKSIEGMLAGGSRAEWVPPIVETIATADEGTEELVDALDRHRRHLALSADGSARRHRRSAALIKAAFLARLDDDIESSRFDHLVDQVVAGSIDPWTAAESIR